MALGNGGPICAAYMAATSAGGLRCPLLVPPERSFASGTALAFGGWLFQLRPALAFGTSCQTAAELNPPSVTDATSATRNCQRMRRASSASLRGMFLISAQLTGRGLTSS